MQYQAQMMSKFYAIIVAGGSGTRMGTSTPKQFLELGGRAILQRSIEKFVSAVPDVHIVTVLPKDHIKTWKEYCLKVGFPVAQLIVEGGITRFHSVKNALERIPDEAVVAVHDGVRPLVTVDLIRSMYRMMETERAVVPVVPMTDTLKALRKEGDKFSPVKGASVDRASIFGAQTPQFFRSRDLKSAYTLPFDTSFTDDASVAERKEIPLTYVDGERYNIKITTPQDLDLAERLLFTQT